MKIHSIETFGTHEGPGIRLVIFLQGCNLQCAYCHNPDTISLKGGKDLSINNVLELLEAQKSYFGDSGGLTVSGGEPTLQAKELIKLFTEVSRRGFHIALDTNGTILTSEVKELLGLTDLALIDLKHFDSNICKEITGQGNETVFKMIEFREASLKKFWIRYVLVPGLTDQANYLEKMAEYFSDFKYLEYLEILPYHNLGIHKYAELKQSYRLAKTPPANSTDLQQAVKILSKHLPVEKIRY